MAQLVECVPNFSEGNNQQVRGGGGLRARTQVCSVRVWGAGLPCPQPRGGAHEAGTRRGRQG